MISILESMGRKLSSYCFISPTELMCELFFLLESLVCGISILTAIPTPNSVSWCPDRLYVNTGTVPHTL